MNRLYLHHYIVRNGSCEQILGKKDTQSSEPLAAHASMELSNQETRDHSTANLANF